MPLNRCWWDIKELSPLLLFFSQIILVKAKSISMYLDSQLNFRFGEQVRFFDCFTTFYVRQRIFNTTILLGFWTTTFWLSRQQQNITQPLRTHSFIVSNRESWFPRTRECTDFVLPGFRGNDSEFQLFSPFFFACIRILGNRKEWFFFLLQK